MLTILLLFVALLLTILTLAALKPGSFSVEREQLISASPDTVFGLINDFNGWRKWSPWEDKDPAMQRTLSGPASGVGAHYAWQGNGQVGSGEMEITVSEAPRRVGIALHFIKPFEGRNQVEFTLTPESGGTRVRWRMQGPMALVPRIMSVFVSMDRMIGRDFEKGLQRLQAQAQGT